MESIGARVERRPPARDAPIARRSEREIGSTQAKSGKFALQRGFGGNKVPPEKCENRSRLYSDKRTH